MMANALSMHDLGLETTEASIGLRLCIPTGSVLGFIPLNDRGTPSS